MRRTVASLCAAVALAAGGGPNPLPAETAAPDCTDYCAEKAAAHCERIDSWSCTWYILGCLAGCGIAQL